MYVFLAECGFDVTALDVSEVGLAQCNELARSRGVSVETVCADLDDFDLGESRYDLITKIYYYEPSLFPAIRRALKPGGHFLFQTFSLEHATVGTFGPKNPAYLASQAAVLDPFASDRLLHYQDIVLRVGDDTEAVIRMIARVP
jgi:SAM-dependent methyltransferase